MLPIDGSNSVYRQAWWGEIQRALPSPDSPDAAFLAGERALIVVPVVLPGVVENVAWGVLRIGVHLDPAVSDEVLISQLELERIEPSLADGLVAMLQATKSM